MTSYVGETLLACAAAKRSPSSRPRRASAYRQRNTALLERAERWSEGAARRLAEQGASAAARSRSDDELSATRRRRGCRKKSAGSRTCRRSAPRSSPPSAAAASTCRATPSCKNCWRNDARHRADAVRVLSRRRTPGSRSFPRAGRSMPSARERPESRCLALPPRSASWRRRNARRSSGRRCGDARPRAALGHGVRPDRRGAIAFVREAERAGAASVILQPPRRRNRRARACALFGRVIDAAQIQQASDAPEYIGIGLAVEAIVALARRPSRFPCRSRWRARRCSCAARSKRPAARSPC